MSPRPPTKALRSLEAALAALFDKPAVLPQPATEPPEPATKTPSPSKVRPIQTQQLQPRHTRPVLHISKMETRS